MAEPPSSVSQITTETSTTSGASVPADAPPATSRISEPETTVSDQLKVQLQERVVAFVKGYFAREPDDTIDVRRERIEEYVLPDTLAGMYFGDTPTETDPERMTSAQRALRNGLRVTVEVTNDDVKSDIIDASYAFVTTTVHTTSVQGEKTSTVLVLHPSEWALTPQGWMLSRSEFAGTG